MITAHLIGGPVPQKMMIKDERPEIFVQKMEEMDLNAAAESPVSESTVTTYVYKRIGPGTYLFAGIN